jgi:hypothetical protein
MTVLAAPVDAVHIAKIIATTKIKKANKVLKNSLTMTDKKV